jgi:RNA recognition motif-containing protein
MGRERDRERRGLRQNTRECFDQMHSPGTGRVPRGLPTEVMGNGSWNLYPLLSKTLTVANLPPDFAPKDLFDSFSEFGKAEGAFVYAFPDVKGRKVGEVAMSTYLFAQKVLPHLNVLIQALENMDGRYVDGYALEVSYKPAISAATVITPDGLDSGSLPIPVMNPSSPVWAGPCGPGPFLPGPLQPVSPSDGGQNPNMWPFSTGQVREVPIHATSQPIEPPSAAVASEPSPPPPYSALPPTQEGQSNSGNDSHTIDAIPPKAPYDPCNLFIKNLDDEVISTQRDLENLFAPFGTITSTFLATYAPKDDSTPPVSKGFGFVAFSRAPEADFAREKVHGMVVGRKKVFVSYAEKKEDRQMRLKTLFANMEKATVEPKAEEPRRPLSEVIENSARCSR